MRTSAILALAGAVLALGLAGCGEETDAVARPGRPVEAAADVSGATSEVVVPTGRLTISVGDPVATVPADETARLEAVQAPSGGSVLPVGLDFDQARAPLAGALAFPAMATTVSVRACGSDVVVGEPYAVGSGGRTIAPDATPGYFVPLPCKPAPAEVDLVVAYDGVDQVIPAATGEVEPGRADGLAAIPVEPDAAPACPTDGWSVETTDPAGSRLSADVDCAVAAAYRTPYVAGQGWAPDGQDWAVVDVTEVRLLDPRIETADGEATYRVTGIEDASTVGGVAATQALTQQDPPRDYVAGGTWVFAVPDGTGEDGAGDVSVDLTFDLALADRTGSANGPDSATVRVTGALVVP